VSTARKPLIHVILLGSTLKGADDESAYLDGYGLIDAEHARTLADNADIEYVRVPDDVHYHRADHAAADGTDENLAGAATETAASAEWAGASTGDDAEAVAGAIAADTVAADTVDVGAVDVGAANAGLPDSAYVYRPNAILDAWLRILCGTCQWPHCDAPAWNADLDHDQSFDHRDPANGGRTTAAGMKAYCRTHHRIKHSGTWAECHNPDRSIDYLSPTGHRYHSPATGYLDLLGINPDDITDPGPGSRPRRRRRTRAENKVARVRAERRRQQARIDLTRIRHIRIRTGEPPPDDDGCPF